MHTHSLSHTHSVRSVMRVGWMLWGGWLVHGLAHSIRLGILFRHWTETSIAPRQSSSLSDCLSQFVSQSRISIIFVKMNRQYSLSVFFLIILFYKTAPPPSFYLSPDCQLFRIFNHTFCLQHIYIMMRLWCLPVDQMWLTDRNENLKQG